MTDRAATGAGASRLRTDAFDYALAAERIAQRPCEPRDASRLLEVPARGELRDHVFTGLPALLRPGDLLVANETRVRRARLRAVDELGRPVELLVLERLDSGEYRCLAGPARRAPAGARLCAGGALEATVVAVDEHHRGARRVRFHAADAEAAIAALGSAPLPPYIHAPLDDAERYQTVYATGDAASAAAPTAGLHVTPAVLDSLRDRGVGWATLRLDVGLATFAPIRTEHVDRHPMHAERYVLPAETAARIAATRGAGGRVVAVGTTVVRVLESCAEAGGEVRAGTGVTELFITPGHRFRAVDGLLTNFHQPRSSLLVLLAAFAGEARWREAYAHALDGAYRFLSFGDCMLCWARRA